jgi:hypothetical protein
MTAVLERSEQQFVVDDDSLYEVVNGRRICSGDPIWPSYTVGLGMVWDRGANRRGGGLTPSRRHGLRVGEALVGGVGSETQPTRSGGESGGRRLVEGTPAPAAGR